MTPLLLVPFLSFQAQTADFDPSKFTPAHFAAFEKTENADVPKGAIAIDASVHALMASGRPSGKTRPMPAEHAKLVAATGNAVGNPTFKERAPLYKQEAEVVDGKKHVWVAVTDEDVGPFSTDAKGRSVNVAVRNLGSVMTAGTREHVYFLINFRIE